MSEIPNTKYITINKDGVFVVDKPATCYRGKQIIAMDDIKENFVAIQKQNPNVQELHVGAFETEGKYSKPSTPSGKFGRNAWCRVKLFDGRLGPWVFHYTYSSASGCARFCAYNCGHDVRYDSGMRSALLTFATKEYETKDGIYKITIEKLVQKQK